MRIPWLWIKKSLLIKEDIPVDLFLEEVNYLGLECEKSFSDYDGEILINFLPPSNRKDLNSWLGLINEVSLISNFSDLVIFDNDNEKSKIFSKLKNAKVSEEDFSVLILKNLRNKKSLVKFLELISLKTAYKIEFSSPRDFKDNLKGNSFSKEEFLLKVSEKNTDFSISVLGESDFFLFLCKEVELFSKGAELEVCSLSKSFFLGKKERKIVLEHSYLENKLGIKLAKQKVIQIFKKIKFDFFEEENGYLVTVPFYRKDLIKEEDLLEEIGKHFDYNKIPAIDSPSINRFENDSFDKKFRLKEKIIFYLASLGFHEVMTYSLVNKDNLIGSESSYFRVANPRSLNHEFYRQFIFPSHLELFQNIFGKGFESFPVFEISKIYSKTQEGFAFEREKFSFSIENSDFGLEKEELSGWIKSIIEKLFFITGNKERILWKNQDNFSFLKEGQYLEFGGNKVGFLGFLKEDFIKSKSFSGKNVLTCEIDLEKMLNVTSKKETCVYKNFSKSPVVKKDLSFFISKNFSIGEVLSFIEEKLSEKQVFVFNIELIDIYQASLEDDQHSLCFRIEFSGQKENLETRAINNIIEWIFSSLEKNFSIFRR